VFSDMMPGYFPSSPEKIIFQQTAGQDEIELDIDSLDPKTLYKLYHYVKVNTSKSSSKKAKSPKKGQRSSAKAKGAVKDLNRANTTEIHY